MSGGGSSEGQSRVFHTPCDDLVEITPLYCKLSVGVLHTVGEGGGGVIGRGMMGGRKGVRGGVKVCV